MTRPVSREEISKAIDKAKQVMRNALSDYSLEYDAECKELLIRQVLDFIEENPKSIFVKIAPYPHTSSTSRLLSLEGVIPMFYREQRYNLPIKIFLPHSFPVVAPLAFVNPTSNMEISSQCRHVVQRTGEIRSDYLTKWEYPSGNLISLVGDLQIVFSESTPLYEKTNTQHHGSTSNTTTNSNNNNLFAVNPLAAGAAAVSSIWGGVLGQQPVQQPVQQPIQHNNNNNNNNAYQIQPDRDVLYRRALTTTLSTRLAHLTEASINSEKEYLKTVLKELQSRSEVLVQNVDTLQKEREKMDKAAHELGSLNSVLELWLRENEPKIQGLKNNNNNKNTTRIDPDNAIIPADDLSHQALLAQATDISLEDTMSQLEKSFEENRISLEVYLKQIRALSRKQFTARALSKKIAAKQSIEENASRRNSSYGAVNTGSDVMNKSGTNNNNGGTINTALPGVAATTSNNNNNMNQRGGAAQLPIGDAWHSTGGILINPLAAAAHNLHI